MREIKCRIWDTKNKTMIYPDFEYFRFGGGRSLWDYPTPDLIINHKTGILTGSIGLKDRNGKEIYEGDVLYLRGDHYVVNFSYGSFYMKNAKNDLDVYVFHEMSKDTFQLVSIIGNKYENPELLK